MTQEPWYELRAVQELSIREFAAQHGLRMIVEERREPSTPQSRFSARFQGVEIMERGCLVSTFGDGSTPEEAINDYRQRISMTRIAVGASFSTRREIDVPRLRAGAAPERKD